MAKFIKYKLSWKPSDSDQIVDYKLYWSKEDRVSYDSHFIELGNDSEVYLPDIFKYVPRKGEPAGTAICNIRTTPRVRTTAIIPQTVVGICNRGMTLTVHAL